MTTSQWIAAPGAFVNGWVNVSPMRECDDGRVLMRNSLEPRHAIGLDRLDRDGVIRLQIHRIVDDHLHELLHRDIMDTSPPESIVDFVETWLKNWRTT